MRYLFMYNPALRQIIEAYDVEGLPQFDRAFLMLEMLMRCSYPCDVFDSYESGLPYGMHRRWLMEQLTALL